MNKTDTITTSVRWHHSSAHVALDIARIDAEGDPAGELTDPSALAIASWWQAAGPHGRTFAQLASTGTCSVQALLDAIAYEYQFAEAMLGETSARELDLLATWALNHESRIVD